MYIHCNFSCLITRYSNIRKLKWLIILILNSRPINWQHFILLFEMKITAFCSFVLNNVKIAILNVSFDI